VTDWLPWAIGAWVVYLLGAAFCAGVLVGMSVSWIFDRAELEMYRRISRGFGE